MDTKASVLIQDLVTGEFFPAYGMTAASELHQSSAALRWVRIWDGADYHLISLKVPKQSFLGVVLSWKDNPQLWRSELFKVHGYPVSVLFLKVGASAEEFDVGVLKTVHEEDPFESSGVVEYDIDVKVVTPFIISEIVEDWKEEYESWQQRGKKHEWDAAKPDGL